MSSNLNNSENQLGAFELELFKALRFYGFTLPESEEEIQEFLNSYGDTLIEMPNSLSDPKSLFAKLSAGRKRSKKVDGISAMAAHSQSDSELPKEVLQKMDRLVKSAKSISRKSSSETKKKKSDR